MRHNSETRASKATCAPSCVQSVETIVKHSIMGYITLSVSMQIVSLLIANILQVLAITTRLEHEVASSRNFRRHIASTPFPEWELGLREAVYQALLRERNLQANLREYLYTAPIIGRQDSATPFGDIAILARGQLYSAAGGFQFVQDPYQNDCDGCHNAPPRCDRVPCENWKPEGHERLLALWTVKRIRHRDANYGYRYELEYKVSPMDVPVNEPFVTRNGRFDYSIAGHTFIVKADARHYDSTYQNANPHHDKVYRSPSNTYNTYSSEQWSPNFGPNLDGRYLPPPPPAPPTEEYYDEDPRKAGYPNVLYGPPELYTQRTPYTRYKTKQPPTYDLKEDERQILRNLIDTLSSKTSTTRQGPLSATSTTLTSAYSSPKPQTAPHFYTMTMSTRTSPQSPAYTISQLPLQTSSYPTTYSQAPVLPTIPMQTSYGTTQILQETHADTVPPTKPLFTPATIRFPTVSRPTTPLFTTHKAPTTQFSQSTRFVKYSEPDPLFDNTISPTAPTLSRTTKHKSPGSDDFDDLLFGSGDATTVSGKFNTVKFPGDVNIKQPPGEQVIKVVDAPNATPHGDGTHQTTLYFAESPQPTGPSPTTYHVDFNDTQHLQPGGETYITIPLDPSTGAQPYTSPEITLSTASSSHHDFTTQPIVQTRRSTTPHPVPRTTTPTIADNIISATKEYTTLSTKTPPKYEPVKTSKPTRRTRLPTKTTAPIKTYKTPPPSKASRKTTKTTREMPPSTKPTPPSTSSGTSPLVSESTFTQPTKTTSLLNKETSQSTSATESPTKATTAPPTKPRSTRRRTFSTKPIQTTSKQETTYISTTSFETTHLPTITDAITTSTSSADTPEQTTTSATSTTNFQPSTQTTDATTNEDTTTDTPKTTHGLSQLTIKPIRVPRPLTKATTVTTLPTTPPPTISRTSTKTTKQTTTPTKKTTRDDFLGGGDDEAIPRNPTTPRQKTQEQTGNFDLDIFGEPQKNPIKKPSTAKPQRKQTTNSNEADDIFGSQPENNQPSRDYRYDADFDNEQPTSTTSKLEIIYADFYSPSTATSTEKTATTKDFVDTREESAEPTNGEVGELLEDSKNKTGESEPLTSKSYITSVSFEVNKNNKTTTPLTDMDEKTNTEPKPTIITTQAPCNTSTKDGKMESNKILDALALSVVNHAKSIDYLHSTDDTNNNHDVQSNRNQQQKYKRKRTYRIQKVNTRRRNN